MWSGSTTDAALTIKRHLNSVKTQQQNAKYHSTKVRMQTYRSEHRCVAVNRLLTLPIGACAPVSTTRVGSTCGAGGSLVTPPVVAGATSGRLRGIRTNVGAASSSSSSSAVIRTSRRRFGAWLLSAGSVGAGEGSAANGLFPATLSSVVGAGVGLLLLTAGVPSTPSSVVLQRIFPRGILHPRCQ